MPTGNFTFIPCLECPSKKACIDVHQCKIRNPAPPWVMQKDNVAPIRTPLQVSPAMQDATRTFESDLLKCIDDAKSMGLPQGIIVALLHAHALQQTQYLIKDAP